MIICKLCGHKSHTIGKHTAHRFAAHKSAAMKSLRKSINTRNGNHEPKVEAIALVPTVKLGRTEPALSTIIEKLEVEQSILTYMIGKLKAMAAQGIEEVK